MIIRNYILSCLYVLSLLIFMNYSSPLIFWILAEINLLIVVSIFIYLNFTESGQEVFDLSFFYFVIQRLGSIILLIGFRLTYDIYRFYINYLVIFSLTLKLGIFPCFYWIYKLCDFLPKSVLLILVTFQKIPYFFFFFGCNSILILKILFISFIIGVSILLFRSRLPFLLVSSSVLSRFWLYYLFRIRVFFFLFYMLIYIMFINLVLSNRLHSSFFSSLLIVCSFCFLIGISPLSLFFFKFSLVVLFCDLFSFFDLSIFFFFRFLTLFGYFKYFFKSFFTNPPFYFLTSGSFILLPLYITTFFFLFFFI